MFCFYIIIIIVEVKFQVKILYQLTKSRSTLVSLNFRFEAKNKGYFYYVQAKNVFFNKTVFSYSNTIIRDERQIPRKIICLLYPYLTSY